ncbi:MAG TPA: hypothetical protein VEM95_04735, partial [Thermoplasmata archaeon]|nr:hypothetical protein [Thermoplasmata archaeon]
MSASPGRANLRPLTILLVAVAVVTSAGVGVLGALVPRFVVPPPPPLAIRSVAFSPNPPIPGQQVSIVAEVSGRAPTLSVSLGYASAFADQSSGGVSMLPDGQGGFEGGIGPFGSGTEVWFVVSVSTSDQGPLLSNYTSFQVGNVYRNESAGLRVTNVSRSVQDPQPFDTVTVRADI